MAKIKIKKENRGKLHEDLNIPKNKKIPASKLKVKESDSPAVKKRKVFAKNARKWKKGQDGLMLPNEQDFPDVESYHAALDAYHNQFSDINLTPIDPINPIPQDQRAQTSTSRFKNFMGPSVQDSMVGRDLSKPIGLSSSTRRRQPNWGNIALGALAVTDALIPEEPIKAPVVKPVNSYNQNPYGTGSQAIAEDGLTLSTTGYKANSKDRNKRKLRIPSNHITMKNVPFPVIGTGSDGSQQVMYPEGEYLFPNADYVDEQPLAKKGKKMGKYISKSYQQGGRMPIQVDDPNDPRLRAYQDSMILYNGSRKALKEYNKARYAENFTEIEPGGVEGAYSRLSKSGVGPKPVDYVSRYLQTSKDDGRHSRIGVNIFKKPVQPVVYNPEPKFKPVNNSRFQGEDLSMGPSPNVNAPNFQQANYDNTKPTNYSFTYPTGPYNEQKTIYFPDEAMWSDFIGKQRGVSSQKTKNKATATGYMMQSGGTIFKSQEEINQANQFASNFAAQRGTGRESYVARNIGDPVPQFIDSATGKPFVSAPSRPLARTLPSGITENQIQSQGGSYWYEDPQTGNVVDIDPSIIFNMPKFRKPVEQAKSDLIMRQNSVTSLKKGGKLSASKAREMLKDGKANGKKLTEKQRKYFGMVAAGKAENGIEIEDDAFTPLSTDTLMINGDSHENGGTLVTYGGRTVEAEAGEPAFIDDENSLIIMGNLKNPVTGNKFKHDAKMIAKKEAKVGKLMDYATELVNTVDPYDKWDNLKFNAGTAMMTGARMKSKQLLDSKEHLSDLQEAMLSLKNEGQETARNGLKMPQAQMGFGLPGRMKAPLAVEEEIIPSDPSKSVAQRHNNPGNMKYEKWMAKFGAVPGEPDRLTKDGTVYAKFPDLSSGLTAMREKMFNRPTFGNKTVSEAAFSWTGGEPYKNLPKGLTSKKMNQLTDEEKRLVFDSFTLGEDSKKYNWEGTTNPGGQARTVVPQTPFEAGRVASPRFPDPVAPLGRGPNSNYQYNWNLDDPAPLIPSGTDAEGLQFEQVLPEIYAAATNQEEPVWMQQFNPELFQDYQVSLQDRRNRITGMGRASRQYLADNANAQATLAAQEYQAIGAVDAEEFRINQGIAQDVTNRNKALLNEAQLKNLQLADTQYVRQSTAKSKTRAVDQNILNSVSNKVLQNRLENRTLRTYENLYPHFRYGDDYTLDKVGNPGQDYLSLNAPNNRNTGSYAASTTTTSDGSGTLKSIKTMTPSELDIMNKEEALKIKKNRNMQSLFRRNKFSIWD